MRLRTTRLIQPFFPSIQWRGPDSRVYLTFDDGPHPVTTPTVLRELSQRGIRASFFVVGRNADRFPGLIRELHSEGHVIGNHTYDHMLTLFKSPPEIHAQIRRTSESIRKTTGISTSLFRPPFGYFGPSALRSARELRHRMVLWDVDTVDSSREQPAVIAGKAVRNLKPGSVVLFHDNEATSASAAEILRRFLDGLEERNLKTAPLTE